MASKGQTEKRNTVDIRGVSSDDIKSSAKARLKYRAVENSLEEIENVAGVSIRLMTADEIRGIRRKYTKVRRRVKGTKKEEGITEVYIREQLDTSNQRPSIVSPDPASMTQGTINDIRMGSISTENPCGTCNLFSECVGHPGYIELGRNILNPMVAKLGVRIASCICPYCHHLVFNIKQADDVNAKGSKKSIERRKAVIQGIMKETGIANSFNEDRINDISKLLANVIKCPRAGWSGVQECTSQNLRKYTITSVKESDHVAYKKRGAKGQEAITEYCLPDEFKTMFEGIPDYDLEILGIPDNMHKNIVTDVIVVIPPIYRQPVSTPTGPEEDTITIAYIQIINAIYTNGVLKLPINKNDKTVYNLVYQLMMSNKQMGNNPDAKKKSVFARLGSKGGLFRKNIMGKRSDGAGRNVITCSSDEQFGQFGTPVKFMNELYITETLTAHNIAYYTRMIAEGKILRYQPKYSQPGMRNYANCNRDTQPKIGDIVFRPQDLDDYAIHNRQPSLHRQSMMAHRPNPSYTDSQFRLHRSDTTQYNADFDGDEMNLNTAQGKLTQAEAQYLMAVHRAGETPNGTNYIGLIGSITTAACHSCQYTFNKRHDKIYRLCLDKTMYCYFDQNNPMSRKEQLDNWVKAKYAMARELGMEETNGRLLFSMLLPMDFQYQHDTLTIINGIIVTGSISMDTVGPGKINSIPQKLIYVYNEEVNRQFITDATFMYSFYNSDIFGFSIGIGDCLVSPDTQKKIEEEIHNVYLRTEPYFADSVYNRDEYETEVTAITQDFGNFSDSIALQSIEENYGNREKTNTINALKLMIKEAKSKGSITNVKAMFINIGQQYIGSKRVIFFADGQRRFIPYFDADDFSLDAGGFIKSNYTFGVSADEMFPGDICARDSSTDTTNRLPLIGEFQRQATRTFEGVVVTENGAIMNSLGRIVDPCYADGYLAEKLIKDRSGVFCMDVAGYMNKLRIESGIYPTKLGNDYEQVTPQTSDSLDLAVNFQPMNKLETNPYLTRFEMTRIAAELAIKLDESASQRQRIRHQGDRLVTLSRYFPDLNESDYLQISDTLDTILSKVQSISLLSAEETKDYVREVLGDGYAQQTKDTIAENLVDIVSYKSNVRIPKSEVFDNKPNNMSIAPIMLDMYKYEELQDQLNFEVKVKRVMPNGKYYEYDMNELLKPQAFVNEF